jgi:calreticulin
MPSTSDMATFGGDTPYSIMFGPDICGYSTKRVHAIFTYGGKNLLTKQTIPCETDELTHVYTLILHANNTYAVLIDNQVKESGDLEEHWDFLAPKTIKDPEASKPEEWDENEKILDVTDVKPDGHDDIPETVSDPEAKKPDDWDDEDDGEWEAPTVKNPEFAGAWVQKEIDNPAYKGIWEAADIANPEYAPDASLYKFDDLRYVGFELWQVKAGTIFDNVLVTDDVAYAAKFAEDTWGKNKDAEKSMFDAVATEKKAAEDAESKKLEEEAKATEGDDADAAADEDDADEYEDTGADATKEETKDEL